MDLQEVIRRILFGHWVVIVVCVVLSAGAIVTYHLFDTPMYTASTRVVLDAPAPTSGTEATSVADAAKAIVTSPTHVVAALKAAGVVRDPVKVISNINLTSLGTSGVLLLTVRDSNAVAAAGIANALADDLIQTRLAVSPAAQKTALDTQIKAVTDQISSLNVEIASLKQQLQALPVDPSNPQAASVRAQIIADRITADDNEVATLTQQLIHLDSERSSLGSASDTTPSVIDKATVPTKPDPSRLPIDLALAVIIGSVLGVALAAGIETFRPTLASSDSLAKTLGVPVLGWIPDASGTLPMRLKLAAAAADVRTLELVGLGEALDLPLLARNLRGTLGQGQGDGKGLAIFAIDDVPARYQTAQAPASGFVLVAHGRIRKSALAAVVDLVSLSGRPLLGIIAHRPDRAAVRTLPPVSRALPRFAVVPETQADPLKGMSKEMQSDLWGAQ
ncbi:MAG TPA: Wzz/FepE/Etk N-terminal domain-containing protein [Candidatus Dormibacteraeota bacterium]|nr:Wzz/FepE/Etk N-terminal domain-containing protein [Candidatus Dormibacteraeota bacterium]